MAMLTAIATMGRPFSICLQLLGEPENAGMKRERLNLPLEQFNPDVTCICKHTAVPKIGGRPSPTDARTLSTRKS